MKGKNRERRLRSQRARQAAAALGGWDNPYWMRTTVPDYGEPLDMKHHAIRTLHDRVAACGYSFGRTRRWVQGATERGVGPGRCRRCRIALGITPPS